MNSPAFPRWLPAVMSGAALALAAPVTGAGTLSITHYTAFDQHQPGVDDPSTSGGGSCEGCALLESGLDVAASEYLATYNHDPSPYFPPYSTYSAFTALSGGRVGFGLIQGMVGGSLRTTEGNDDGFYAEFRGSWADSITVNAPGLAGQPGVLTGTVLFEYGATTSVTASPDVFGEVWGVELTWLLQGEGLDGINFSQYELDDEGPVSQLFDPLLNAMVSPAPTTLIRPVTWRFTFGTPFDVSMELYAIATGGGPANAGEEWEAVASLNFMNTLAWQGITSVTDAQGNPVEFTLESGSDTDWRQPVMPVPLPAGGWLLAGALATLAARRRR